MLGLMSVMALTTIGISVEERERKNKGAIVELVGVPSKFIPFHIRCTDFDVQWMDDDLQWQTTPLLQLLPALSSPDEPISAEGKSLIDHIYMKSEQNKSLSFTRQQNTIVLWIQPDGINTATILKYLISTYRIPIRIGSLPVLEQEDIFRDVP